MTPAQESVLRNKLAIISGNAELIERDDRSHPIIASKAKTIMRAVCEIAVEMGWEARPEPFRHSHDAQRAVEK